MISQRHNVLKIHSNQNTSKLNMCYNRLCRFRKIFKIFCTLLTLLLVGQELFTFAIVKPTTTSKEEKDLEISDLPEVVVCLEPGFDTEVLKNYGYKTLGYYRGSMDGNQSMARYLNLEKSREI